MVKYIKEGEGFFDAYGVNFMRAKRDIPLMRSWATSRGMIAGEIEGNALAEQVWLRQHPVTVTFNARSCAEKEG